MLNENSKAVDLIVGQCLQTMPYEQYDLIDYVKYAVRAAKSMFDTRIAKAELNRIRANFQPGIMPLGAEVELSNLGYAAVGHRRDQNKPFDSAYDGFRYFHDFQL